MIILASQSPRRREILERAGIPYEIRIPGVPEEHRPGETPQEYVRRLSQAKALAVRLHPNEIVLGADTVVVLDEHILEKPVDAEDARRMLRMLSGRAHTVMTGVTLAGPGEIVVRHAETRVCMAPLTPRDIEEYVASGEPMDKAGAYAIQGLASKFIERVDGCYLNVVGLPVSLVFHELRRAFGASHF